MRALKIVFIALLLCIAFQASASASAADFAMNVTGGNAPLTVHFTDLSANATAWQWNFGDGTQNSTVPNPTHVFTNVSSYNVTLTVNTTDGQATIQKPGCVNVQLLVTGAVSNPLSLSMADLYSFPLITENVSYNQHGTPMSMNVTGATLNAILNQTGPVSSATSVTFTGSDGFSATIPLPTIRADPNAIVAFNAPPDGRIRNVVPSQGAPGQWARDLVSITVNSQAPVANFTTNATSGTAYTTLSFTDKSTNYPASWQWNFGDGTDNSTLQNPVHTYPGVGTYDVTLTVTNAAGTSTMKKVGCINITSPVLTVGGRVSNPLSLSMADLYALPLITENVTYTTMSSPDPQYMYVTGASLNTLLNKTAPAGDAVSVTFTGSDEFSVTVPLSDIRGDNNSIIAFNAPPDGSLRDIIPSQGAAHAWVYDLASITVNGQPPAANFTANTTAGNAPLTVQFNDTSANTPTSWTWSFGDGSISHDQNPTHTYNAAGAYSVSLTAMNAAGQNSKIRSGYINVSSAPMQSLNFTADVTDGITPLTVHFTDLSANATAWQWNFGDGTANGTLQSPTHTFTNVSNYNVTLTVTTLDGNITAQKIGYIVTRFQVKGAVGHPLNLSIADMQAYPQGTVHITSMHDPTLDANVSGPLLNAILNDTQLAASATTITFAGADGYTDDIAVSDIRADPNGIIALNCPPDGQLRNVLPTLTEKHRVRDLVSLTVHQPAPVAGLTANITSGPAPLTVQFNDTSSNDPISWNWSFGDNSTSTLRNVTHTYDMAGNYTVILTVTNSAGSDTVTKSSYIVVGQASSAAANFTANVTDGVTPLAVRFTDLSANATAWQWNFGDGTPNSTAQNPTYAFTNVSSYNVTLTITTAQGQATAQKIGYINTRLIVTGAVSNSLTLSMADLYSFPLIAENVTYVSHGTPGYMNVTGASLNAILNQTAPVNAATSVTFTGSDGFGTTIPLPTIRADPNSIIAFNAPPDGTIRNVVPSQGAPGQWSRDLVSITVNSQAPVASFTASPLNGSAPLAVSFSDKSTYCPASWNWSFGDGTPNSTVQNPTHTFNATGNYTVILTVANAAGRSSMTKTGYIVVNATQQSPVVLTVNGSVSSPRNLTMAGLNAYTNITVNAPYGTGTLSGTGISLNALLNDSYPLGNATSVTFLGADGYSATASLAVIRADPAAAIMYTGNGTLRDVIPAQHNAHDWVSNLTAITVNSRAPTTSFLAYPLSGNAPLDVTFSDKSAGFPDTWSWNFGDGNTSNVQNPTHTYGTPGNYTVNLTASNAAGSNTTTRTGYITVDVPQPGQSSFTLNLKDGWNLVSIPLVNSTLWAHQLDGAGIVAVATYNKTTDGFDPYVINGPIEDDKQIVMDNAYFILCSQDTSITIWGIEPSAHTADMTSGWNMMGWSWLDSSTALDEISLVPDGMAIARYNSTTDGYDPCVANGPAEDNFALNPGEGYFVLTSGPGYMPYGITTPVAGFSANVTAGSVPLTVQFTDLSTNGPASWSWNFGDGNTSNVRSPAHTYSAPGNYTVSLNVSNPSGSNTATRPGYIRVTAPLPSSGADFTADVVGGISPLTVQFTDTSVNATSWQWDFGDGTANSTAKNPAHVFTNVSAYNVTLTVNTPSGTKSVQKAGFVNVLLQVKGAVVNPMNLSIADLRGYPTAYESVPYMKGADTYYFNVTGVLLNDLLNSSHLSGSATIVTFTGADGFSQDVPISTIRADNRSIIALDCPPEGTLRDIIPSQYPSAHQWVRDLVSITVE